jgi:hypothetical protein
LKEKVTDTFNNVGFGWLFNSMLLLKPWDKFFKLKVKLGDRAPSETQIIGGFQDGG